MNSGNLSIGKNVPQKKAIGIIKKLEKVDVSSCDFAQNPEITPKQAKIKQFSTKISKKIGLWGNPTPKIAPAIRIKLEAKSPRTTPDKTSPSIMSVALTGLT